MCGRILDMDINEIVRIASETAAKVTIDQLEKNKRENIKRRGDRRLHNTKLLFKNYDLLKEHCKNAIYDKNSMIADDYKEENCSAIDILDSIDDLDSTVYINAIQRSVSRTKIILAHIDRMIEVYKLLCENSSMPEEKRRWRIFWAYNFEKHTIKDITNAENIDRSTYYRDVAATMKTISALIFGIEGLTSVRQR